MKEKRKTLLQELLLLLRMLKHRRRWQLLLLLGLMVLSSISQMVSLGAIFPFLSAVSDPKNLLENATLKPWLNGLSIYSRQELVVAVAILFMVAAVVANGLRLLTLRVRVRLAAAIGADISDEVYRRALHQPYSFHLQHNTSDLLQMVTADTQSLTQNVLISLFAFLNDIILAPALVLTLITIDGRIAIGTALLFGGAYWAIYALRRRLLQRNSRVMVESGKARIKSVQEGVGGIRDVLLDHTQLYFGASYQRAERSYRNAFATNFIISQSPRYFMEALTLVAIALLVLGMGKGDNFNQIVPVLGTLALGAKQLLPVMQEAFNSVAKIQGSRAAVSRVLLGLTRPMEIVTGFDKLSPLPLQQEICLNDVWFRYSQENDWVLRGLSLTIPAKTTVAFVGSTGSGKTTTTDLILGLLSPQRGEILVDGMPLQGETLHRWHKTIAHVPQSVFLSDGAIAENIAFGVSPSKIDMLRVRQAAQMAQIADFIEGLPAGYDTYVGERGVRLSGGQRQRLGIARALYRQASVLVFDEATSALDNATEREVMQAINDLSGQFTVILIAHRLSTVERCNYIFELSGGILVAQGSYQQLLDSSTSFRKMATLV